MSDPTYFRIVNGQFGLAVIPAADPAGKLWPGVATDLATVTIADYDALSPTWSCQVTEMRMTAAASTRTETVEDTICQAGRDVPNPQKSTWAVVLSLYQDANYVALQQFADEHDAEQVYFFCAFDGTDPPKAAGRLYMAPLPDLGGVARTNLKATVTWPVFDSQRLYGNATASQEVPDDGALVAAAAEAEADAELEAAGAS